MKTFQFESGPTIEIRIISHHLKDLVLQSVPEPVALENPLDEAYLEEVKAWQRAQVRALRHLMLHRGAAFEVDVDAVTALRADMAEMGVTFSEDDRWVYLYGVCVGSQEEELRLRDAIFGLRTEPTR